jgi:arsenite methyltransferase
VDELEFDEGTARALEVVYATRDVKRRRRLVQDAIAVQPGESVLDVGCGPGFYVAELAERVGPKGRVAGVDMSRPMLALAQERVRDLANIELSEAPATELPFEDQSFDAAISVQVLEYVEDVGAAVGELHRVLRPGGRVVVWDVDWATVSVHSEDQERMARAFAAWDRHLVHPSLPRTLSRLMREAGFEDVTMDGHAFTTNEFTPEAYGASLVAVVQNYLQGLDDYPEEEATAWAEELWALGADFYFSCVQCCVSARRVG